jgi:glycosyltransferase involved in cell wall biosynthesis
LLVDDGSNEPAPETWTSTAWSSFQRVDVLTLRRNLGHQRALAVGLCHVEANIPCRAVLVMDGDGEDAPLDIPRLLDRLEREQYAKIVFAERTKRSESTVFRIFYHLYRLLHVFLTGISVRVGNFSVTPIGQLRRLVAVSDLWNHYAAAIFKARLPFVMLPTERAQRLAGQSRMNFVALVIHGLSAISVFSDRVGARLLIAASVMFGGSLVTLGIMAILKALLDWSAPFWLMMGGLAALLISTQIFTLLAIFVFVTLGGREGSSFLPLRDYVYFIAGSRRIYPETPVIETVSR